MDVAEGTAGGSTGHSQDGDAGCAGSSAKAAGRQIGEVSFYAIYQIRGAIDEIVSNL